MTSDSSKNNKKRPFIGMLFKCCNAYGRLYLNPKKKEFYGRCPKCGKAAVMKISSDGQKGNFFVAD